MALAVAKVRARDPCPANTGLQPARVATRPLRVPSARDELIDRLIQLAVERHDDEARNRTHYE